MQNRVQSAKKPRGLFTFGWSLLCWPSYRDTLFMGLARKAATSSCLVLFIHRVTMEVPRPHSFAYSHIQGGFFPGPDLSPPLSLGQDLVGSSGMRFWGGCGMQTDLCVWWRISWVLCGSSLDASKGKWSNGIPAVIARTFFLGWIWGKVGLSKEFHHKLLQLYGKNNL